MIIKAVRILCMLALVMSMTPKGNAVATILNQEITFPMHQSLPPDLLHFGGANTTQGLWSITQSYEFAMFDPAFGTLNGVSFQSNLLPLIPTLNYVSWGPDPSAFSLDNVLKIDTGLVTQEINVNAPSNPPGFLFTQMPFDLPVLPLSGPADSLDPLASFYGTGSFQLDATWSGQILVNFLDPMLPVGMVDIMLMLPPGVVADLTLSLVYDYEPGVPPQPVPEPATMLLLASGLVGLVGLRRKFRKK